MVVELTDAARGYLAKRGYDPMNGARPLGRVIQDEIKKPLTDELLFGSLANGGKVVVDLEGSPPSGKLTFAFEARPVADAADKTPRLLPPASSA